MYLNRYLEDIQHFINLWLKKKLLLRTEEPFESFFLINYFVSYRRLSSDELNMNDDDQKYRGSQYLLPLLLGFFPNKFAYWFYKLSCWATPAWILAKLGSHSKGLGGIRKLSIRLQLQNPNAFWLLALEINAFTHSLEVKRANFLSSERRTQPVTAMCLWTADIIGWFTPTTGRPIPIHEFSCEQQNYRLAVIVWQTLTFFVSDHDSFWFKLKKTCPADPD